MRTSLPLFPNFLQCLAVCACWVAVAVQGSDIATTTATGRTDATRTCFTVNDQPVESGTLVRCFRRNRHRPWNTYSSSDYVGGHSSIPSWPAAHITYYSRWGTDVWTDAKGCVTVPEDHASLGNGVRRLFEASHQQQEQHYDTNAHHDPASSLSDTFCRIYAGDCFASTTVWISDHQRNATAIGATARAATTTRATNSSNAGKDDDDHDDIDYYHHDTTHATVIGLPWDERYCGERRGNGCGPAWFPAWSRRLLDGVSGLYDECSIHDACYETCGKLRSDCDKAFHQDVLQSCGVGTSGATSCRAVADLFYGAVSRFGSKACREARRGRCESIQECEQ
eukprot:scaffold3069_cov215-Amphora_coffeaeformis.AAC.20